MNKQKQILLVGAMFIAIFTILFITIRMDYTKKYSKVLREIDGLEKIINLNRISITIKSLRGLSPLNETQSDSIKEILFISKKTVDSDIKNIKNKQIQELYKELASPKSIPKYELFKKYTQLLKLLNKEIFDLAETSSLLIEGDQITSFLIDVTILKIPEAMENIAKIRGVGVAVLNTQKFEDEDSFIIQSNARMFLTKIYEIKYIVSKLPAEHSSQLSYSINLIMTDTYNLKKMLEAIRTKNVDMSPEDYFFTTTKLINKIDNLYINTKNILQASLQDRKENLDNKLMSINFFYALAIIIILFFTHRAYNMNKVNEDLLRKKKSESLFIYNLRDRYSKHIDLGQIFHESLASVMDRFKAVSGTLYLYNKENEKLYLGSSYGVEKKNLKQTLDLHDNIISKNILEKKIKILDIDSQISLGTIETKATKLITLPIMEFEESIGTLQLAFNRKTKDIDIEFLEEVLSLMASYISKALQDDESLKYLNLIDKNVLMSQTDLDGDIVHVSEELCQLSGYTKKELLGQNHRILRHPDMPKKLFVDLWETIKQGQTWKGEMKNRKKDGGSYWIDTNISADCDINGNIIGYTGIRSDITDKKKIQEIAMTDGLTSLYNRRHFDSIFPQQINISKRNKDLLAFLLIDIDHFKQYNDIYGHQDGDIALKRVAKALKKTLSRADDFTFRLGGEEFGMLYHVTNEEDGYAMADLVRHNIENLQIAHKGNSASKYITISSGLYIIKSNDISSMDEIYKKSDELLYIAKNSGRNQVAC